MLKYKRETTSIWGALLLLSSWVAFITFSSTLISIHRHNWLEELERPSKGPRSVVYVFGPSNSGHHIVWMSLLSAFNIVDKKAAEKSGAVPGGVPELRTKQYVLRGFPGRVFTVRDLSPGQLGIMFVRDPIQRYVSGFYKRQREGLPGKYVKWTKEEKATFKQYTSPNALAEALASEDPRVRQQARAALASIEGINRLQTSWAGSVANFDSRIKLFLYIGREETLREDFESIKALLGMSKEHPFSSMVATPARGHEQRELSERAVAAIEEYYADDFALLAKVNKLRLDKRWPLPDDVREATGRAAGGKGWGTRGPEEAEEEDTSEDSSVVNSDDDPTTWIGKVLDAVVLPVMEGLGF